MGHKRMTFMVTPDIEDLMDEAKRIFYDKNQSEMIRMLLVAGLDTVKDEMNSALPDGIADYGVEV